MVRESQGFSERIHKTNVHSNQTLLNLHSVTETVRSLVRIVSHRTIRQALNNIIKRELAEMTTKSVIYVNT